jgi:hypothetical protein
MYISSTSIIFHGLIICDEKIKDSPIVALSSKKELILVNFVG